MDDKVKFDIYGGADKDQEVDEKTEPRKKVTMIVI